MTKRTSGGYLPRRERRYRTAALLSLATLLLAPLSASASYLPGETLNPNCLPLDAGCVVVAAGTSSTTNTAGTFTATSTTATSTFAGNVQIAGTASSANLFSVLATIATAVINSLTAATANITNLSAQSASIGSLSGAAFSSLTSNSVPKWNNGTWSNSLIYDTGTAVGIGTTSPFTALTVQGNGFFSGSLTGDVSSSSVLALGSTYARSLSVQAADVVNVKNFGAQCDGVTDDAAAINAAITYLRNNLTVGGVLAAKLVFPQGNCLVKSTINLTNLRTTSVTIEGGGAVVTGQTNGTPIFDALGARWLRMTDLTIVGSTTNPPNIGVQIGRTDITANNSSDNHSFKNVFIKGSFTFADMYNLQAETSEFDHVFFWNSYPSATAYNLVQDGLNHWNAHSAFVTESEPVDSPQSFNENVFVNCDFREMGGGTPIWMAQTARNNFISSYVANTAGEYGVYLYSNTSGDANTFLSMDVHFETTSLKNVFLVTGANANPVLPGFVYRDQHPYATSSVFAADTGIASVTMNNANIQIAGMQTGATLVDNPAVWNINGSLYLPSVAANNLTSFTGQQNIAGTVTQSGAGTFSSLGSGLVQSTPGGVLSVSLPTTLNISSVASQGSISSLTASGGCYHIPGGGSNFPSIAIAAPPAGGTQAAAVVSTMKLICPASGSNIISGGSGYAAGNVLTVLGGTCTTNPTILVTAVNGAGAVTAYTGSGTGLCTSLPSEPISVSGGSGSGLQLQNLGWQIFGITLTAPGGGYTSTPSVTINNTAYATLYVNTPVATVTLSNSLSFVAGTSNILLASNGYTGIGTTTPYATLEVWGANAASTSVFAVVNSASTTVFSVFGNGNSTYSGSLFQSSDQRLKTNISSLDASSSLSLVDQLDPVSYTRIDQPDQGSTLGFIAQEVQKIFPNLVTMTAASALTPGGTLTLNYTGLIAPLVGAVQALSNQFASLTQAITTHLLNADRVNTNELCVGTTCVTPAQFQAMVAAANAGTPGGDTSAGGVSSGCSGTSTAPVIEVNGNNPAIVRVGASYSDNGATITGPVGDTHLDIKTFLNGVLMSPLSIDTSQAATDTIDYVVTDQNGLTSTSTRTVVIQAPSTPSNDASTTVATPSLSTAAAAGE